jgi:hypothetical protein
MRGIPPNRAAACAIPADSQILTCVPAAGPTRASLRFDSMIDPVLRDEQPHPIRRAAANLNHVYRFVSEADERSPEAITLTGILMSLDRCVRQVSNATHIEDFWKEARSLVKHAETVVKLREDIQRTPQNVLLSPMKEAHDALLEAADKLTNTERLAVPF